VLRERNKQVEQERALASVLLLLTGVSGLVDAASYLNLSHTFVANMTGNIVFVGFALAGAVGFSVVNSAVAVVSFFIGALMAARIARWRAFARPDLLRVTAAIELSLVLVGLIVLAVTGSETGAAGSGVVGVLALAMGFQSTTTSRLQVPGFNSTVVLTTMLGTMAATSHAGGGPGTHNGRRLLAISCMFAGGLVGAVLTLHVSRVGPLLAAALALAVAYVGAHAISHRARQLQRRPSSNERDG
jgi:uncharacterized membrane protein YoaK (UPF0700 family)